MTPATSDLLLHPVRLRIVLEASSQDLTARELAERMPDVPQATLYRHLPTLADAGVLEVVSERRIRGGVERTFRLAEGQGGLSAADAEGMTLDEHRQGFAVFAGALVGAFSRYLDAPGARPAEDPVGYRQVALWLSDEEFRDMAAALSSALEPFLGHEKADGRRRVVLSTIAMPDPE